MALGIWGDRGGDIVRFSLSEALTRGDDEVGQSWIFDTRGIKKAVNIPRVSISTLNPS